MSCWRRLDAKGTFVHREGLKGRGMLSCSLTGSGTTLVEFFRVWWGSLRPTVVQDSHREGVACEDIPDNPGTRPSSVNLPAL